MLVYAAPLTKIGRQPTHVSSALDNGLGVIRKCNAADSRRVQTE